MRLFSFLESNAAAYERVQRLVSFNYRAFLRELEAEKFFEPSRSYLDVGCGTGFLRDYLPGAQYLGVDLNPDYIAEARRKRGEWFQVGDAMKVGQLPRSFDRIICIGLLHHLDDAQVQLALQQFSQRLNRGGEIFVIDALWPAGRNFVGKALRRSDNGLFVRPLEAWATLFRSQLELRKIRPFAQWPFDYVFIRAAGIA